MPVGVSDAARFTRRHAGAAFTPDDPGIMTYRTAVFLAAISAAGTSGCRIVDPGDLEGVGAVQYYGDTTVVTLPSTVLLDSAFSVRFHTFGGGCITAVESTVRYDGMNATVTPIDRHSGADLCEDVLHHPQHQATLRFSQPGVGTVIVQGASYPDGGTLELRFPVVVAER